MLTRAKAGEKVHLGCIWHIERTVSTERGEKGEDRSLYPGLKYLKLRPKRCAENKRVSQHSMRLGLCAWASERFGDPLLSDAWVSNVPA